MPLPQHTYRMTTLHVTNGDSVGGTLQKILPAGTAVLPWRDILHDGPVPGGVDADTLRQTRARFLASRGFSSYELALADLAGRDAQLAAMRAGEHVVLWFEPDIYDQLQLLQIMARLYLLPAAERPAISVIASDELLGPLSESQLARYLDKQRDVREVDLELAAQGWEAFTAPDSALLLTFTEPEGALFAPNSYSADHSVILPHLHSALRRLLQEYPSPENGLSRTEQQTVNALQAGPVTLAETYRAAHRRPEEIVWLDDWSFAWYVDRLMSAPHPLVEFVAGDGTVAAHARPGFSAAIAENHAEISSLQLRLTETGHSVAEGKSNAIALNGIDRWIGGAHLQQPPTGIDGAK